MVFVVIRAFKHALHYIFFYLFIPPTPEGGDLAKKRMPLQSLTQNIVYYNDN